MLVTNSNSRRLPIGRSVARRPARPRSVVFLYYKHYKNGEGRHHMGTWIPEPSPSPSLCELPICARTSLGGTQTRTSAPGPRNTAVVDMMPVRRVGALLQSRSRRKGCDADRPAPGAGRGRPRRFLPHGPHTPSMSVPWQLLHNTSCWHHAAVHTRTPSTSTRGEDLERRVSSLRAILKAVYLMQRSIHVAAA